VASDQSFDGGLLQGYVSPARLRVKLEAKAEAVKTADSFAHAQDDWASYTLTKAG